jgi:8-oxo-dGTP pyrophosphatase MutT (NUDIX family)
MEQKPRFAAVGIVVYPTAEDYKLVLTQRPSYPGVHSDQISFPGGQVETGDAHRAQTALRETEEEIGWPALELEVLGEMSELYIPPSNFLVQPVVLYAAQPHPFQPDPLEVAAIIELPLVALLDNNNKSTKRLEVIGASFETPCYLFNDILVWGATAMMLREFEILITPYFESRNR